MGTAAKIKNNGNMLDYNEITVRKFISLDGEPYVVLSTHVFRKQQRKPVNQTKLRNLKTGKVVEHSFHQSERVEEADIESRKVKYLYNNRGEFWFCEENDPGKRFLIPESLIGEQTKFLKANTIVDLLSHNGQNIGFNLPIKMDLAVKEAPPGIRGNTAQGGTKSVVLETGAAVSTPMFINAGDIIRINTETGEYVERVSKN